MIKLTHMYFEPEKEKVMYVSANAIVHVSVTDTAPFHTEVHLSNAEILWVKETPEEILTMPEILYREFPAMTLSNPAGIKAWWQHNEVKMSVKGDCNGVHQSVNDWRNCSVCGSILRRNNAR